MRGFTLLELMIVTAIIGILATLATLDAVSWYRESRLTESRDKLLADIEDAKLKSIAGVPHAIIVDGGGSGTGTRYFVCSLNDTNGDFAKTTGETSTTLLTVDLPPSEKINVNGGDDELWFDRKGIPRTSGWGVLGQTATIWYDANGNGVCDSGEPIRKVVLSNSGRVQYEK